MTSGPHVFFTNSTASNVVIGAIAVPAIAALCVAFGMFDRGGAWIAAGVVSSAIGVGLFAAGGWLARRVGIRIEVDARAIRSITGGRTTEILWDRALTVSIERGTTRKGSRLDTVRVDDGDGSVIEAAIPAFLGRALEPGAASALAIFEREASVPLATREARRAARRGVEPVRVHRGTYGSFPRTGWVALAFGALLPIPAVKLALVDHFYGGLAPSAAFAAACFGYAFFCWAWVGELELDDRELRGMRRLGGRWSVPRSRITHVTPIGSPEMDTDGLTLALDDGSSRKLPRLRPRAIRDALAALGTDRSSAS